VIQKEPMVLDFLSHKKYLFRSICDDHWVNELKMHWYILILILFSKGHHNDMKEGLFISKLIDYINSGPIHASQAFV
jgi:hypothetical protein